MFKKIQFRLRHRKAPYGHVFYPSDIAQQLTSVLHVSHSFGWRFNGSPPEIGGPIGVPQINFIPLASQSLEVRANKIDWFEGFEDVEDGVALHRWNWILTLLSERKYPQTELVRWVSWQLENWFGHFLPELERSEFDALQNARWESYTVGERIANTAIFYLLTHTKPPEKVINGLIQLTSFLLPRLEYRGAFTGNHVVNNARAIYLAGAVLDVTAWMQFATSVFRRELLVLVTRDGFLREGSSHYQLLFTRWILEVYYFAHLVQDHALLDFLFPWIKRLLESCWFFLVLDIKRQQWSIPLFGDISPDFTPSWLIDIPSCESSSSFKEVVSRCDETDEQQTSTWGSLWGQMVFPSLEGSFDEDQKAEIWEFPQSGWFRIDHAGYTLFCRADEKGTPNYVGHHHQDLYHFCLFYEGMPVLVDCGRKNYLTEEWGTFGLSPQAHNTVLIDGIGAMPLQHNRYPREYTQASNQVQMSRLQENTVQIMICSDGFRRLISPVDYIRTIYLSEQLFCVEDYFKGDGNHLVRTFFHWAPEAVLKRVNETTWQVDVGGYQAFFRIEGDEGISLKMIQGGDSPLGWIALQYGEVKTAPTFVIELVAQLPLKMRYTLQWA